MSQYLSLSAFASEVGWHQDDVMKLITDDRIKAHQGIGDEPYIPKSELASVRQMSYETSFADIKEERLMQDEADHVSRAYSRSKIASEHAEATAKTEKRRLASAQNRAK